MSGFSTKLGLRSPAREARRVAYVENTSIIDLTSAAFVDLVLFPASDAETASTPRLDFGVRAGYLSAVNAGASLWVEAFRESYETGAPVRTAFGLPLIWAPTAAGVGGAISLAWRPNTFSYVHPAHAPVVYGLRAKIDAWTMGSMRIRWSWLSREYLPELVSQ